MDYTLREWINLSEGTSLAEAAAAAQSKEAGMTVEAIRDVLRGHLHSMLDSIKNGLQEGLCSVSGLTGGQAPLMLQHYLSGRALCGSLMGKAEVYALATAESNACMGKIVAAPTAGACGILPGALAAMMEERGTTEEEAINALLVAGAVGEAIAVQASISGAEGGCQAECGTGAAMTAAALCALNGGDAVQCMDAAAFALMNLLGLVCDPVGGLVEVPCVYRNVGATGIAFTAADLALSGIRCPIEPDEVVLAMKDVGDLLPASLRETGEGGCAACPSVCARLNRRTEDK